MARTQSFDREVVVRAARTLFWELGYESASIPELERATGLSRSSLYNTFGSKRGLFDAAVQSYLNEVIRPRLAPLQAEVVAPGALVAYLSGLRDAFAGGGSSGATANGCLLINAAGAPISQDAEVARVITDYRHEMRAAIARGVAAHAGIDGTAPNPLTRATDLIASLVISALALAPVDPEAAAASLTLAVQVAEED